MFERFTDRARKVMAIAHQEAQRRKHPYIDTEHILFGLISVEGGVAAAVFEKFGVDLAGMREAVQNLPVRGADAAGEKKVSETPTARKVIEYAIEECRALKHNHIGTEHILLGLLRDCETIAGQVLTNLGLTLEKVRDEAAKLSLGDEK
jgi:ATP-dependent Clp protease ATP-binding subunit ClpC